MATDFSVISNSPRHLSVGSHLSHLSAKMGIWNAAYINFGEQMYNHFQCIGQLCFIPSEFTKNSVEELD